MSQISAIGDKKKSSEAGHVGGSALHGHKSQNKVADSALGAKA